MGKFANANRDSKNSFTSARRQILNSRSINVEDLEDDDYWASLDGDERATRGAGAYRYGYDE